MKNASLESTVDKRGAPRLIYLTNAYGEATGYGSLVLEEADYDKVAFEQGPGHVIAYLAEIGGVAHVVGNLEVAYRDDFWGEDGAGYPSEDETRTYCRAACAYIRPRLTSSMQLLPLDEGDPGRIVIQVAIPLNGLSDCEATSNALRQAFGEMIELPDTLPDSEVRVCDHTKALRAAGYAVCVFSPEELQGISPKVIEDALAERGNEIIEQEKGQSHPTRAACKCDNCQRVFPYEDLNEVEALEARLDFPIGHPQCVIPAGECPECGALAYLVKE